MISGEDCEFIQRFEQKRNPEEKQELLQTEGNQVTFLSFNNLSFGEEVGKKFSYQFYCWLYTIKKLWKKYKTCYYDFIFPRYRLDILLKAIKYLLNVI